MLLVVRILCASEHHRVDSRHEPVPVLYALASHDCVWRFAACHPARELVAQQKLPRIVVPPREHEGAHYHAVGDKNQPFLVFASAPFDDLVQVAICLLWLASFLQEPEPVLHLFDACKLRLTHAAEPVPVAARVPCVPIPSLFPFASQSRRLPLVICGSAIPRVAASSRRAGSDHARQLASLALLLQQQVCFRLPMPRVVALRGASSNGPTNGASCQLVAHLPRTI
mmetsp:Transcript_123039/g.193132  ORF Transcript_123039/g.193132 Transcript_123039/m.193132 type:complete len:226 (-) Transcript_123039:76-753(-)